MKTKAWLVVTVSGAFLGLGLMWAVGPLMARDLSQLLTSGGFNGVQLTNGVPGGLASDGTNFLVAGQTPEGRVIAMRVATSGIMVSSVLDLGPGGMPGAAFGGGKYLIVWPDFTEPPSDLYGEFINPDGTAAGSPFLVEADADAAAVGGVGFDGTNFLIVWEGVWQDTTPSIEGRFITSDGSQEGPRWQISGGGTAQKFPALAWNGANYLVTWTSQLEGTNLWNIRGCRIGYDGVALDEIAISDNPAQQPWPSAVASDGTNWLAVWTRETGPYLLGASNAFLPMLFGRLVASNGETAGSELVLRRAGLGQFRPSVGFHRGNYLVAWSERQLVRYPYPQCDPQYGPCDFLYWTVRACQLKPTGEAVLAPVHFASEINTDNILPAGLNVAVGGGGWLCVFDYHGTRTIFAGFVFYLNERAPVISNFKLLPTGEAQLYLSGSTYVYGLETSTNLVDWGTGELGEDFYHLDRGQVTVPAPIGGGNQQRLFRAYSGRSACKDNLRLIHEAREHWLLDHNFAGASPVDSDLFGPGRYLLSKPACPLHGTYQIPDDPATHPSCSYGADGHTFW